MLTRVMLSPNMYKGRLDNIRLIVIHDGETGETATAAEGMGEWFSRPTTQASAHKCVDSDSVVICVADENTAWAAPGANADGLQIEFAGKAAQNTEQWQDAYSARTLINGALVCAEWATRYKIPVRWLTDAQLADGVTKGFTTHAQVSRVFKRSTHTDPGKYFPSRAFLGLVMSNTHATGTPVPVRKPASIAIPTFPGVLQLGSYGSAVLALQRRLKAIGGVVSVDGKYGPLTAASVKSFQQRKGLIADGIYGPVTHRKLWTHTGW